MDHLHNRLRRVLAILFVAVCFALASGSVCAQKLLKPVDGATVREVVRIAITRDAVPRGGYISVFIDGRFVGAGATVSDASPQAVVFAWNSKAQFEDATLSLADRLPKDGNHKLRVQIHEASGMMKEAITSSFVLANKAPRLSPNDKIKLAYRFQTGAASVYRVKIDSQMTSNSGSAVGGGIPITGEYKVIQTIEDARPDGSALVSYRIDAGGSFAVLGQPAMINGGKESGSVYKEVNRYGQVIRREGKLQDNVLSRSGRGSIPDILAQLPRTEVKIGDSWKAAEKEEFRIEGVGEIVGLGATSTLEDLEWEKGQVCARIKSVFSGAGRLVANDKNQTQTRVSGEGIFYVGVKTGKLVKSSVFLSSYVNLDAPSPGSAPSTSSSSSDLSDLDDDNDQFGRGGGRDRTSYGAAGPGSRPGSATGGSTEPAAASGDLRVTINTEL
ncbi:MAG: hypothetical protein Q7N50_02335 [Armatimonadota bacterium]|nr:hypothetical protein [Armatimonadota bacterium]